MRNFFHRQGKFRPRASEDTRGDHAIPEDLWVKCPKCSELIYTKELDRNARVCPKCGHHFRLNARARIALLTDPGSFTEWDTGIQPENPLQFADLQGPYDERLLRAQKKTGETEALITGIGAIDDRSLVLVAADFDFLGGSMGSVWGEKLARAVERAVELNVPVLTINASGGARMHEGLFSLMQMAKTVASFTRLGRARLPHFSLLVDPCYGGVTASYATVADVILAEPAALIGFAGQRVIEQVTNQKLPPGFQTAEFLLEHGMADLIVERNALRLTLSSLIDHHAAATAAATGTTTGGIAAPGSQAQSASANGQRNSGDLAGTSPVFEQPSEPSDQGSPPTITTSPGAAADAAAEAPRRDRP